MQSTTRRQFLGGMGRSVCSAAVGLALAEHAGFAETLARFVPERLRFGALDPLVDLMQATPADALLPLLVEKLNGGASLGELVAAGALANARALGGTNYNGYHALMALVPSFEMAGQVPQPLAALPVLKVLHRNARFIQAAGGASEDALLPLEAPAETPADDDLVAGVRALDVQRAERGLAALESRSTSQAYDALQSVVRDDVNVHRVVLAWRAYDLLRLTGEQNAVTLLRQSVRFCIDEDSRSARNGGADNETRQRLPQLLPALVEAALAGRERGKRAADDLWTERLSDTIFAGERAEAAQAVAMALSEGIDPEDVGAALSIAATRLLLNDPGLTIEQPGKPLGSVHGASVGVHASDAANAWRSIARVGSAQLAAASLIAGAYHTAGQSQHVGKEANDHASQPCELEAPGELLTEIDGRIRERDQKGACQAARRYCGLGHASEPLFAQLLEHALSEDGALHAEKYFRTAQDEHSRARPAHRAQYAVALTRVMASHYGFPAPGYAEARKLLGC
jgi:hypothetical protein